MWKEQILLLMHHCFIIWAFHAIIIPVVWAILFWTHSSSLSISFSHILSPPYFLSFTLSTSSGKTDRLSQIQSCTIHQVPGCDQHWACSRRTVKRNFERANFISFVFSFFLIRICWTSFNWMSVRWRTSRATSIDLFLFTEIIHFHNQLRSLNYYTHALHSSTDSGKPVSQRSDEEPLGSDLGSACGVRRFSPFPTLEKHRIYSLCSPTSLTRVNENKHFYKVHRTGGIWRGEEGRKTQRGKPHIQCERQQFSQHVQWD